MTAGMVGTARHRSPARAPLPPPRPRSWWPDLLSATAVLSLVIVVALWLRNQGLQQLFAASTGVTSLGRLTGLIAADLLLIQVFLMARVPWIERTYGQDKLARWHRVVGFTSFDLMLAHVVLITIGYAGSDKSGVVSEFVHLVLTYPGMLLALAATVALVMVAVTSIRAARRKLRYESWHLLHLYAYLGVGFSIPHEVWTGTDFARPASQVFWWTAYGISAGSILIWRLGVPAWRSWYHAIRVHAVVPEAPGVVSVWLSGRNLDRLPVRAGQFFNWRFLAGRGWTRAHPYSLSAAPRSDMLRITIKALGDDSARVPWLRPGTRVLIEGPYGALTPESRRMNLVTMIASGIGITPLRALAEQLPYGPGEATLIYRARTPEDFAFHRELETLAARRGLRVIYLPGPRGHVDSWLPAHHGRDDRALRKMVPGIAASDVYVCGPEPWMESVARAARRLGVPDEQLHMEQFGW